MVPGENTMVVPIQETSVADEPKIICIIRDMTNCDVHVPTNVNLPESMTGKDLMDEVARKFSYEPNTFNLTLDRAGEAANSEEMIINNVQDQALREFCVPGKRNSFNVMQKDGIQPVKVISSGFPGSSGLAASADSKEPSYTGVPAAPPYSSCLGPSGYASYGSYSYSSALIKSDSGYVGLVNQAMTCYLNSLLQTLFMIPEFRNAVYRWEFDGAEEESTKSIPYQLQRLFLHLQTSKKRAVETTDITKSFGWDSSEAWQQHDVQELCRVMFEALEKKWKNTDQANLINQLYQGKWKDYVKCLQCNHESARTDSYLDIPLVIRPFGASVGYGSVEKALSVFVEPETLEDNNQYFCEKCNKKCDAHKGLKFISFPYLLTLQLKRFDFDYTTMHRIKLNDRMTFPEMLNLNHLIVPSADDEEGTSPTGDDQGSEAAGSLNNADDIDEGIDEGIDIGASASGTSTNSDSSLSSQEAVTNDNNLQTSKRQGPFEYELFSIMVHSGSAAGGHYYAYIKSFKDGQWYSFNDQHVTPITHDDIRKTYGGSGTSRSYYSSTFTSSTNAYMLMYRQIDKLRNKDFMKVEDFPPALARELEKLEEKEEAERKQRERDRNTCKIKLYCFHPVHQKQLETRLEVHKDVPLQKATQLAWKLFELDGVVPSQCVRLVKYDENEDYIERSFEGEEDSPMELLLGGVKATYLFGLFLELRQPEGKFQEYKPGGVTVRVYEVDLTTETIGAPLTLRADLTDTVAAFKKQIAHSLGLPSTPMRCVLEKFSSLHLMHNPDKQLQSEGFHKSHKVFIECSGKEDDAQIPSFMKTKFYKLLDRYENTIRLQVCLPPLPREVTLRYRGLQRDVPDFTEQEPTDVSKSQSDTSQKTCSEIDEGIGESETDVRVGSYCHDNQLVNSDSSTGTLCSSGVQGVGHSCSSDSLPRTDLDKSEDSSSKLSAVASGTSSQNLSPDENGKDQWRDKDSGGENWDLTEESDKEDEEYRRYFSASLHLDTQSEERQLTIYVDKRIKIRSLKQELETYVGTSADNFKVFRVYSGNQELEHTRLSETLSSYQDDGKVSVKLGRALKKDEFRVKVYQLLINDPEPSKFLIDTIFAKGMTVLQSKKIVLEEVARQCNLHIALDRCRLRKKQWRSPSNILFDGQVYDDDVTIINNWEVFVELLDGPEQAKSSSNLSVYIRRWCPSKYEIGPLQEIVLYELTLSEFKNKISDVSGIAVEDVEFAKGKGTFPCEVSVLDITQDLDWNPSVTSINCWPLSITDDGCVVYYRNFNEKLLELTEDKRREVQQRENVRLAKYNSSRYTFSPRKEKALKIYTDDSPTRKEPKENILQPDVD